MKLNAQTDQNPRDEADNRRAGRIDKTAGCRDGHQARQKTVGAHASVRLAFEGPHVQHCAEGPRASCEHGVDCDRTDAQAPAADAPRVLPGLNPNQPKARMKHPISTGRDVMTDDGCSIRRD